MTRHSGPTILPPADARLILALPLLVARAAAPDSLGGWPTIRSANRRPLCWGGSFPYRRAGNRRPTWATACSIPPC